MTMSPRSESVLWGAVAVLLLLISIAGTTVTMQNEADVRRSNDARFRQIEDRILRLEERLK